MLCCKTVLGLFMLLYSTFKTNSLQLYHLLLCAQDITLVYAVMYFLLLKLHRSNNKHELIQVALLLDITIHKSKF